MGGEMFARRIECPVEAADREWVEGAFAWLAGRAGVPPLASTVFLPTSAYFPGPFSGEPEQVQALVVTIATRMGLAEASELRAVPLVKGGGARGLAGCSGYAGGAFRDARGEWIVAVEPELAGRPIELVATIVHMLAHLRFEGEPGVPARPAARERFLAAYAVYAGFGIFGANAAVETEQAPDANPRAAVSLGLRQPRPSHYFSGYLTEEAHGYALACFAFLRGESAPKWAKYLDTNPRVYLKRSLRYLEAHAPERLLAARNPA